MESGKSQTGAPTICYITQADNSVVQVEVEHRARGQDVLDKLCRLLGIVEEEEYFGIQYTGGKSELLWLNNRNRLSRQISSQPPYHLYFKVKFFVPPEDLLLESTRLQFYINVVHQLKDGLWDPETTLATQSRLIALMAYVQFGKYNQNTTPCKYACFWPDTRGEIPAEAIRLAASFHRSLDGCTVPHAQYDLLRTVYTEVPCYGTYFYEVKDIFERRQILGVGPECILLCNSNFSITDKFPYCRVHTITTSSRVVTLNLLEDDGSVKSRNYQLATPRLANALYRAVTEVHAFFRCDSVRKEVLLQTKRDLRDAITFHHNGKEYAFDVRYTFREVYDRARRHLYHCNSNTGQRVSPSSNMYSTMTSSLSDSPFLPKSSESPKQGASGDAVGALKHKFACGNESSMTDEELQELVQKCLWEITLCRVCMDAPVSRVFIPCGHIICCAECSDRIEQCSICRKMIETRHPCFLPWNTEANLVSQMQLECRRPRRQSTRSEASPSVSLANSFFPHAESAPTCHLYSTPSINCLEFPATGTTSGAGESLNADTPIDNPVTSDTQTQVGESLHDSFSYCPNRTVVNTQELSQEHLLTHSSSSSLNLNHTASGCNDENVQRPVHITWQLSDQ